LVAIRTLRSCRTLVAMKKTLLNIFLTCFVLNACTLKDKKLHVVTDDLNGITLNSPIYLKNQQIGKVIEIGFNKRLDIVTTIEYDFEIDVPDDSKLRYTKVDVFTNAIELIPGKNQEIFETGDTIYGITKADIDLDIEHLVNKVQDAIDNSKPVKNQETLIEELNEINNQLEQLNK